MYPRIVSLVLLALGTSLMAEDVKTEQAPAPPAPEMWAGFNLKYLIIKLKGTREVRRYAFQDGGFLFASIGKTQRSREEHAWSYQQNGEWLQILDEDKKTAFRMRPIHVSAKQIIVDNGHGKKEVFDILQDHEPVPQKKLSWDNFDLFSCSLDLKSTTDIRWFMFHSDGSVSVTVGKKKGWITAPLFRWQKSGAWMQILDDEGRLLWQMRPATIGEKEISIDNGGGKTEVFTIHREEKPAAEASPDAKSSEPK
jgi:hypothetical protein